MDRRRVIEFLAQIPLLQRLPSLSLHKIAQSVRVKRYENGEFVVHEGKTGELIYFILEGQAEISGPADAEEGNYPTVSLKKFDNFGHENYGCINHANVIALSKLTCLVLSDRYSNLLQPKSIWNADEASEGFSLVERTLCLEPLEMDIFRGFTLPGSPSFRQVFGGQLIGQFPLYITFIVYTMARTLLPDKLMPNKMEGLYSFCLLLFSRKWLKNLNIRKFACHMYLIQRLFQI